jgi:hypothetical protein
LKSRASSEKSRTWRVPTLFGGSARLLPVEPAAANATTATITIADAAAMAASLVFVIKTPPSGRRIGRSGASIREAVPVCNHAEAEPQLVAPRTANNEAKSLDLRPSRGAAVP